SLAQVNGAGQMIFGEFVIFTNVYKKEFFAAIHALLDVVNGGFADATFGVIDDFEEGGGMLMSHDFVLRQYFIEERKTGGSGASTRGQKQSAAYCSCRKGMTLGMPLELTMTSMYQPGGAWLALAGAVAVTFPVPLVKARVT